MTSSKSLADIFFVETQWLSSLIMIKLISPRRFPSRVSIIFIWEKLRSMEAVPTGINKQMFAMTLFSSSCSFVPFSLLFLLYLPYYYFSPSAFLFLPFSCLLLVFFFKLGNIAMSMLSVVNSFSCAFMSSLDCWAMYLRYVFHSEVISEETKAGLTHFC